MLKVGTDCSGIEAPIQALLRADIPFEHVFSSDIDRFCRDSIKANYNPGILFEDMLTRDRSALPDIDLYVCGFPCTPYSNLGIKQGSKDPRSNIMQECVKVIQAKTPMMFVLENVTGFKRIEGGSLFKFLIDSLEEMGIYEIHTTTLNTKDFGIPQNRSRLFITGVKKSSMIRPFDLKPDPDMKWHPLEAFLLEYTVYEGKPNATIQRNVDTIRDKDPSVNYVATNQAFGGTISPMREMCPTLTTSGSASFWLTKYRRRFHPKEILLLQGFPLSFNQVVSNTQIIKQAGNSMSVPVIQAVIEALIHAVTQYHKPH